MRNYLSIKYFAIDGKMDERVVNLKLKDLIFTIL